MFFATQTAQVTLHWLKNTKTHSLKFETLPQLTHHQFLFWVQTPISFYQISSFLFNLRNKIHLPPPGCTQSLVILLFTNIFM